MVEGGRVSDVAGRASDGAEREYLRASWEELQGARKDYRGDLSDLAGVAPEQEWGTEEFYRFSSSMGQLHKRGRLRQLLRNISFHGTR